MTWVIMLFVLVFSAVLQSLFPVYPFIVGCKMPFLVGVVMYYAITREKSVMLVAALLAGFLQDSLTLIPLGTSSFVFCCVGLVASYLRQFVMTDSLLTGIFFGSIACTLTTMGVAIILARDGLLTCSFWGVLYRMIWMSLLGLFTVPIVMIICKLLDGVVGNITVRESIDDIE